MYRDLDGQRMPYTWVTTTKWKRRGEITLSQSFVALQIWANLSIHIHTHFASFHCLSNPIYPPVREVFPMHYLCQERPLNSIISFFKVQLFWIPSEWEVFNSCKTSWRITHPSKMYLPGINPVWRELITCRARGVNLSVRALNITFRTHMGLYYIFF